MLGTATLSQTLSISTSGRLSVPTLHCLRFLEQRVDVLLAALMYAKWTSAVVSVPNFIGIAPETCRAAGLRATRGVFTAYRAKVM